MFLHPDQKKKYTIGKILRNNKKLRLEDPSATHVEMPKQLKTYVDELIDKGLKIQGLAFGEFKTKNGLPYPGLIAVEKIKANTIMIRVPVDCLLTTKVAFNSDIQKMFVENPKYFAKRFTSDWEDHILLAFLLYEYQKKEKSPWWNLIRNLPREIDYAIFWNDRQISLLEDPYMKIGIEKQRNKFKTECQQFIKISQKYPQFYQKQTITQESIRWIHTHLVTRCFGKYFEYTTMVPFAELFNHECTDVYYTMGYKQGNPHDQGEKFYDQKELSVQEILQLNTTNGTYDADDYFDIDQDVSLDRILKLPKVAGTDINDSKKDFRVSEDILKDIRSIKSYLQTFISFNDTVSMSFLCQTYQYLSEIPQMESVASQRSALQSTHTTNVKYLAAVKAFYAKLGKTTYSYGIKQKKKPFQKPEEEDQPKTGERYFNLDWPNDKFDEFLMLCSTKDQFEKNSQVYFCYGRLPNKLLLMRYGIALEHNKYDHLFLRIDIQEEFLSLKKYRAMFKVVPEVEVNRFRRFKIKRTKFCTELLAYLRANKWNYKNRENIDFIFNVIDLDRQIEVLQDADNLFQKELSKFKEPLEKNQKKLFDKSLNYHQHFALIYKIQQQRIVTGQIDMLNYARKIVEKARKSDHPLKQILSDEKDKQNWTKQIMMEKYFETWK